MSSLEVLLARLEKVSRRGGGRYTARCPAHQDRDPSLSIGEAQDGRILIKCFAGCTPDDITAAIGMDLWDLAPPNLKNYRSMMEHVHKRTPQQQREDRVLELAKSTRRRLTEKEKRRVIQAVERGAVPDGFADEVRKQASKPLPSESLTSVENVTDFRALVTEANWYENRLNEKEKS